VLNSHHIIKSLWFNTLISWPKALWISFCPCCK